jgi:putative ABC transport system permease protein
MRSLAHWLAGIRCPPHEREFVTGDLEEEYAARLAAQGRRAATRWLWQASLRAFLSPSPLDRIVSVSSPLSSGDHMQALVRDCVVGARRLWTRPLVSIAAIVTVALGIGANVAMFSVAWPVLAAPLPFPDEDRLAVVSLTYERDSVQFRNQVSVGDYNDWRTARGFSSLAAFSKYVQQLNMTGRGEPEQISVGSVTAGFFSTLGVQPVVGRLLHSGDATSAARLLVLGERTWRQRFGADPLVVGTSVRLDGIAHEVIGVAPSWAGLGTIDAEAWVQMGLDPANRQRGAYFLGVIGRLAPGTTFGSVNPELKAIMERAAAEFPQFNSILSAEAEPFRDLTIAPIKSTLVLLLLSAGMVLVVAGVNLAGLQMARHLERAKELAVRRALGASAWQVGRQVLTENLVLAVIGGAVGVVVALLTLDVLESIAPSFGWRHLAPVSRSTVALFAVVVTVVTGVLVGVVPTWRAAAAGGTDGLQTRTVTTGRWGNRVRSLVIGCQVAATAVLLVVAALVAGSQRRALSVDLGFTFDHAVAADVNVPLGRYNTVPALTQFFDRLVERVEAIPGVTHVCASNEVPLDRGPGTMSFVPEGEQRLRTALPTTISKGCTDLLGLSLLAGRWFSNDDATPSVVVSASMATALWPDGADPIGRRVHLGLPSGILLTVVGVAGDIRGQDLESGPSRIVWMPQSIGHYPPKRLLVQYARPGTADPSALRAALKEIDPDLALANVRSLDDLVARATAPRRFALFLLGAFALTAVVLCAVGIYGLLAHIVGHRTQEIGIRVALGAQPGSVARLVGIQIGVAVAAGTVVGLWGATVLSSALTTLLFDVTATEPRVYALVAAVVIVMAALAAWIPTRRALGIQPVIALRGDST